MSVCLSVCLSIHPSIHPYIPTNLPTYLPTHPPTHPTTHPPSHPSISIPMVNWLVVLNHSSPQLPVYGVVRNTSPPFPFSFPTLFWVILIVIFLPVTRTLFTLATCYPPCLLWSHTISTYYSPFFPELFYSSFALTTSFLNLNSPKVLADLLQKSISELNSVFLTCKPLSNRNLKYFLLLKTKICFLVFTKIC